MSDTSLPPSEQPIVPAAETAAETATENASQQVALLANELRGLSNSGMVYTDDPYQIERYHRIIEIAAELTSIVDSHSLAEIKRAFASDLSYRTAYSVVDTATFDPDGKLLLIRRRDNGLWALPGGICEINQTPATNAAREVWEETGCIVNISAFLGIFDSRLHRGKAIHHLYSMLFAGEWEEGTPILTREVTDVGWFEQEALPWAEMTPSHLSRIAHALAWHASPSIPPFFDPAVWQPLPTFQHTPES